MNKKLLSLIFSFLLLHTAWANSFAQDSTDLDSIHIYESIFLKSNTLVLTPKYNKNG